MSKSTSGHKTAKKVRRELRKKNEEIISTFTKQVNAMKFGDRLKIAFLILIGKL